MGRVGIPCPWLTRVRGVDLGLHSPGRLHCRTAPGAMLRIQSPLSLPFEHLFTLQLGNISSQVQLTSNV